ncbi:site-specific integrase [Leptotrichia hongkongensis]|jgi:Site-specific recombinase XerD|uniref:site-specific integrase n=1 Tax=Leptotrichia hongkongensis TaxID=554406 RepID=UPI0035A97F0E
MAKKKHLNKNLKYEEWLDIWMEKERFFIKESTYATYTNIIENHLKPVLGKKKINNITNEDLQNFIILKLSTSKKNLEKGLALKTVKDMTVLIKNTLKTATQNKLISFQNFQCKFPSSFSKSHLKTFSVEEQKILFKYLINNQNSKNLGILLCLQTGLRLGEICGLQWQDINLEKSTLTICRTLQKIYIKEKNKSYSKTIISTPKTKTSNRIIPLNIDFINLIKPFQQNKNNYFITNSTNYLKPHCYRYYYQKLLHFLNLPKLRFHSLRHTFATQAVELGIDCKIISEILGHANMNTTLNLYVHPKTEYKRKCLDLIYKKLKNE